jgi:Glycosyl hydrolases family 2, TIM barrel domain
MIQHRTPAPPSTTEPRLPRTWAIALVFALVLALALAITATACGTAESSRSGADAASDAVPLPDGAPLPGERVIAIRGRQLTVDGAALEIRGVCWNPVPRGKQPPADFAGAVAKDIQLMRAAGINAVRTYEVITDRGVLDQLADAGIWVIMTVYAYGGDPETRASDAVAAMKDHRAILLWVVGNEWNYNGLYAGVPFLTARDRLQRIAAAIRALDPSRPVATVYGELPSAETIAAMPAIQLWGLNVYRGLSFGDLFMRWGQRSEAPMFLAEYGADAWDARGAGRENLAAQAEATRALTQEILAQSSARLATGITLGGTIFEWSDEWWKDQSGSANAHDIGGQAPGGGPHPDQTFNEEWWGVVDIDRVPRPAYQALQQLYR